MQGNIKRKYLPYLYTAPGMFIIVLIIVLPIFYSVYISFTNFNLHHWNKFDVIGIQNYTRIFRGIDVEFYKVFLRTILWSVLNIGFMVVVGVLLALLLNIKELKCKGLMRTVLILPWAVPSYITALVWKGMFNYDFGIINGMLAGVGLERVEWLTSPVPAMAACIAVNVWLSYPFMMVVALGALQSIDTTYYEAAELDGANSIQRFYYITLQFIKPALMPAIILSIFVTFKQFDIIYLMTGGLAGKTDVVMTYGYWLAFTLKNYSLSAAFSVIVFIILLALTVVNMKITRADKEV